MLIKSRNNSCFLRMDMASASSVNTDDLFSGVPFALRYVGSIAVAASMKSLKFDIRTALARECIFRLCEAAGYVSGNRQQKVDPVVKRLLGERLMPDLVGRNVELIVSVDTLSIVDIEDGAAERLIVRHAMSNVSFATGGDETTSEFVCFVAKGDETVGGRRCYVFECGAALSHAVLLTIGRAFNVRLDQLQSDLSETRLEEHRIPAPPRSPQLIDLSIPTDPQQSSQQVSPAHQYVNDSAISSHHDAVQFSPPPVTSPTPVNNVDLLRTELWYHGPLSRNDSEGLLARDGDFLVRQSAQDPNQVVLTGLQAGVAKHLLLIDGEGRVRTKDREFHNVVHLIQYHRDNNLPITSAESAILLRNPVHRRHRIFQ